MTYTEVTDLMWSKEKDSIHCWVTFERIGKVPFGANPNDSESHGREIYDRCVAGDFGAIAEYVPAADENPVEIIANAPQPTTEGAQTL